MTTDGASEGFAEFMAGSGSRLYRLAYLLTGEAHRAEDLTQEVLVRVYAAWPRVVHDDAYAYARRVLVNRHTDWWRGQRWREDSMAKPPEPAGAPDPAVAVVQRDWVVRALRGLTRRERVVLVLRFFADQSEAAVARELDISVGTVKSTTARALAKLRVRAGDATQPGSSDRELPLHAQERR